MIDIHCHMLPGIDHDGPVRVEDSLAMARAAAADGIRQIVATPHINSVVHPPEKIRQHIQEFQSLLLQQGIDLEFIPGAEVNAMISSELLKRYTIAHSNYVLLEFPHSHLPQSAGTIVFNALVAGLTPIVAHPERNPTIIRNPQLLADLVCSGALAQITADSLLGNFGLDARECAIYLLRKNLVHFLATDAHSPRERSPVLSTGVAAAARIIGQEGAEKLVTTNPAKVISGQGFHG